MPYAEDKKAEDKKIDLERIKEEVNNGKGVDDLKKTIADMVEKALFPRMKTFELKVAAGRALRNRAKENDLLLGAKENDLLLGFKAFDMLLDALLNKPGLDGKIADLCHAIGVTGEKAIRAVGSALKGFFAKIGKAIKSAADAIIGRKKGESVSEAVRLRMGDMWNDIKDAAAVVRDEIKAVAEKSRDKVLDGLGDAFAAIARKSEEIQMELDGKSRDDISKASEASKDKRNVENEGEKVTLSAYRKEKRKKKREERKTNRTVRASRDKRLEGIRKAAREVAEPMATAGVAVESAPKRGYFGRIVDKMKGRGKGGPAAG